jgi:hypothetical protein
MTGTEIYKRTATYEREAGTIRLHAPQWKLLLAYDGQRSLAEVALSAEVAFATALPLTEKFLTHGWIEEQPITLDQYLKRTGASDVSTIGSAVPPAVILHAPKPETATAPQPSPSEPESKPEAPTASLPPPLTPKIVTPPPLSTPPPLENTPEIKIHPGPMRLSAVVDYITSLVGNTALGQLLVYRVFLQVPPELLQAEEISSVHLVNDTSLIRSESLKKAIARAVSEVAKRPLPDGVYAAA